MIVCMGLMACDILASPVDHQIMTRDSTKAGSIQMLPGGDALNVAVALGRYEEDVALVGCVGDDAFGRYITAVAKEESVNTKYIRIDSDVSTATCLVLIETDGERHFVDGGESNRILVPSDLSDELLQAGGHLHIASAGKLESLEGMALAQVLCRAKEAGMTTSLDMSFGRRINNALTIIEPAFPYLDIFLPSDYEAAELCGSKEISVIREFFAQYALPILCLKRGKLGIYATDYREDIYMPPLAEHPPVDTTGAGDTFCAGFLKAFKMGSPLKDCVLLGSASSAKCINSVGATAGICSWQETMQYALRRKQELSL